MEENRLKPMSPGYDVELFNQLFKQTEGLRKNLASQIDCRRFGLDYEEILSWFSIKFIYAFNKYHQTKKELLLGYIINSLRTYKIRIIKMAYTQKFSQSILHIDDLQTIESTKIWEPDFDLEDNPYQQKLVKLLEFMKLHLSDNAYMVFEIQLNPPYFIIRGMRERGIKNMTKIPDDLVLEYLGLHPNAKSFQYLEQIKKQIKNSIGFAKCHFRSSESKC